MSDDDFGEIKEVTVYTREAFEGDLDGLAAMAHRVGLDEVNWNRDEGPDFALVLTERHSDQQRQTFLTFDVDYAQMLIQGLRGAQTKGGEVDVPGREPFVGYREGWPEDWVWNNGK